MNTKLQELTEKLREEGIEKGRVEASEILSNAKEEADRILASAKAEADKMIAKAREEAAELDRKTKSELRLFASQSVNALKSEVTDMICDKITRTTVAEATSDADFMKTIILKVADSFVSKGDFTIETEDAEALQSFFIANAKQLLDKGLEIKEVKGKKASFSIVAKDGGYKINCGEEEFAAYFKEFLRTRLIEMLF